MRTRASFFPERSLIHSRWPSSTIRIDTIGLVLGEDVKHTFPMDVALVSPLVLILLSGETSSRSSS